MYDTAVERLLVTISGMPKWLVMIVALGCVGLVAWFDYLSGWQWDSAAFYSFPIVLVVWRAEWRAGVGFAALCAIAWGLTRVESHPQSASGAFVLALSSTFFFLAVVVLAAAALKSQWQHGRARIEMLERTRELELEILHSSEREQERIGRELHDGLCQTLAGIAALSATQSRSLAASPGSESAARAAEIATLLNGAIAEARDLARGLGPLGLRDATLAAALEELTMKTEHECGIACSFLGTSFVPRLAQEVEAHLFRIAQEAINNAIRHSQADRIEVNLSRADGQGVLEVSDNGVGLPRHVLKCEGIGLRTMAYRARVIGASFEVLPREERGTVVRCTFPVLATDQGRSKLTDDSHGS